MIAEHCVSRFSGEVVGTEAGRVVLRNWRVASGRSRCVRKPSSSTTGRRPSSGHGRDRPRGPPSSAPRVTVSGAIAGAPGPAREARPDRIYVEGIHDAELLEKVWGGEELREAAIVVEPTHGVDGLAGMVRRFDPGPQRRLGILLDHLVEGSKESRIAEEVTGEHVLVTGHPYMDVWQGVRPRVVGLDAWPVVPRGTDWKTGVCAALGGPEPARFWRRLLRSVGSYADLEPALVGAVERLLDFLVGPGSAEVLEQRRPGGGTRRVRPIATTVATGPDAAGCSLVVVVSGRLSQTVSGDGGTGAGRTNRSGRRRCRARGCVLW